MIEIQRWLYGGATTALKDFAAGPDFGTLLAGLAFATVFGFVHALMPGHGKIALVSYYLGHPTRIIGSILTSAILILTHVGSAVVLVLAGFTVIRSTLGGAGRAPAFEAASAGLVIVIGVWLFVRALRQPHNHHEADSRVLAFATGLVPCPLTTFIMVYAVANGSVGAGLLMALALALGMIATIFLFVGCTIMLRERTLRFLAHSAPTRERLGRMLEAASAAAVIAFGLWLFAARAA